MSFVPVYILILGFTIIVDYFAGILIENSEKKRKKFYLIASLVANIGVLAAFKYYNFLNDILTDILFGVSMSNPIPYLAIILPIGLSFHTFQAMSYTIEVYRGNQKAERSFGIYALYVMFYPQLVAGPIERPQNLLHQFREKHHFDYQRFVEGIKLMGWGLFKKVVVADRLAILVDNVYNSPHEYHGINFIIATIFFSFQIYCDFSGYSDMAIGAARIMGFNLMRNFNLPYFSKSIHEFWKRWHISLSTWFKDYLYIPLGGNRVSVPKWYFNLFLVFLISGLWHGANWTYIIWGAIHGLYLVFALVTQKIRTKIFSYTYLDRFNWINNSIQVITTFVLVSLAWVYFRASSLSDANYIVFNMFSGLSELFQNLSNVGYLRSLFSGFGLTQREMVIALLSLFILLLVEYLQYKKNIFEKLRTKPMAIRWAAYYFILLSILLFGSFNSSQQFIYFQF
jgi:D-alanyl-lipoteichoic acid acyltransferase DltB (MBOAT superfamily)